MLAVKRNTRADTANRTLVVGLGETGLSVIEQLSKEGVPLRAADSRENPPRLRDARRVDPELEVTTGGLHEHLLTGVDRLVLSPGVPTDVALVEAARARGIAIVGDIDLFMERVNCPVLGVTGSNGKSTVTTLAALLLAAAGHRAMAGGNLGPPALTLLEAENLDFAVLELSSFQLETNRTLSFKVGALLNISADHIDRHRTEQRYQEIKARLLGSSTTAVVNRDDSSVMYHAEGHRDLISFGLSKAPFPHFGIIDRGGQRFLAQGDDELLPVENLKLTGTHNQANALAALALCWSVGVDPGSVLTCLESFKGLDHRCQFVARIHGVTYLNDSKATNPAATVAALNGLPGPLILIAGGQSKDADFGDLASVADRKVRRAYLLGRDRDRLADALSNPV